jgi:hypothetical protein
VARKLSTIEERRQGQCYLFRIGDYRNKVSNPEKLSLVRFSVKMFSVARELSTTRTEQRTKLFFLAMRLQEQTQKSVRVSGLGEDVGIRVIIIIIIIFL